MWEVWIKYQTEPDMSIYVVDVDVGPSTVYSLLATCSKKFYAEIVIQGALSQFDESVGIILRNAETFGDKYIREMESEECV
jgi:hypothetical protein